MSASEQESERDSEPESEREIWKSSDTPEEDWGSGGDDGEWPVKGIVGQEVNTRKETIYEVGWTDWTRADGTNTTWTTSFDRDDLVRRWELKQKRVRANLASESLDIEIRNDIDIHNIYTFNQSQAFGEKSRKREDKPINYSEWEEEVETHWYKHAGQSEDQDMDVDQDRLDGQEIEEDEEENEEDGGEEMEIEMTEVENWVKEPQGSDKSEDEDGVVRAPGRRSYRLASTPVSAPVRPSPQSQTLSSVGYDAVDVDRTKDRNGRQCFYCKITKPKGSWHSKINPTKYICDPCRYRERKQLSRLSKTPDGSDTSSQQPSRSFRRIRHSASPAYNYTATTADHAASANMRASISAQTLFRPRTPESEVDAGMKLDEQTDIAHTTSRQCFNCHSVDETTWRRSQLDPAQCLCNKCGLYERTNHKPRPCELDDARTSSPRHMGMMAPPNADVPTLSSNASRKSPSVLRGHVTSTPPVYHSATRSAQGQYYMTPKPSSSRSSTLVPAGSPSVSTRHLSPNIIKRERSASATLRAESESVISRPNAGKLRNSYKGEGRPLLSDQRTVLQAVWSKAARDAGAASIKFINDIDEEDVPPLPPQFRYLEQGYEHADEIEPPDIGFLEGCDCLMCDSDCHHSLYHSEARTALAYEEGLFTFNLPPGREVIECNLNCPCPSSCTNRVAQHPRQVPIEIFKTVKCGWGARSSVHVEKGCVLGIYTGKLITRTTAKKITGAPRDYLFDLDTNEGGEYLPDDDSCYTVDSYECGNWTRFINHSCDPNILVYPVLYDRAPGLNQQFLAFTALYDINAGTEFTLMYNPAGATFKGKGKKTKNQCLCGAAICTGDWH